MKRWWIIALMALGLQAGLPVLHPAAQIEADGAVNDIVLRDGALLMGTDHGSLQSVDLKTHEVKTLVTLKKIKDFMGDMIDDKVFSVDKAGDRYLILSDSGEGGYSNLEILEGGKLKRLYGAEDQRAIIKARFIDSDHILLGYLSDEVGLYEVSSGKEVWHRQLEPSKFSDFDIDSEKKRAVFSCESGVLTVIDTHTGKTLARIDKINVDNVFSVAIEKNWVVSGGQDRRAGYDNLATGEHGYFSSDFLVYAVALSPSSEIAAYAMHDDNSITLYHLATKSPFLLLKGQKSILTRIVFADEKTLYSASHDPIVMEWKLP
ncbi:WD40 repeat domain-containing protein [Nitratifractor sp.]